MNTRHGVPPGYTPPVTHAPLVTCWRCRSYVASGTAATVMLVIGGREVAAHRAGDVECVPSPYPPHRAAIPASKETP